MLPSELLHIPLGFIAGFVMSVVSAILFFVLFYFVDEPLNLLVRILRDKAFPEIKEKELLKQLENRPLPRAGTLWEEEKEEKKKYPSRLPLSDHHRR